MNPDTLLTLKQYMELTGRKETQAQADFQNKDFTRRGILVKISPANKQGGWRIHYGKWLKWCQDNAKLMLNA